jgi:hypothetical protein
MKQMSGIKKKQISRAVITSYLNYFNLKYLDICLLPIGSDCRPDWPGLWSVPGLCPLPGPLPRRPSLLQREYRLREVCL